MKLNSLADLTLFADSLGVPREIGVPFAKRVSTLYQNNGVAWTVNFLKTVYTDFVRYRAGLPPVGTWYKRDRTGRVPAGCFKPLFEMGLSSKTSFMATQLLRCYTAAISPTLRPEQWKKFSDGVSANPIDIPTSITKIVLTSAEKLKLQVSVGAPKPYYTYNVAESRNVPDVSGKSVSECEGWHRQHRISKTRIGAFLMAKYQPLFTRVLPHNLDHQIDESLPNVIGKIGLIQEPGFKLRAVANPNRVFQCALDSLSGSLYALLRKLPWDCTHQQDKAFPAIQKHLQQRNNVFCVDLTGATDYFPLSLQEDLLRNIVTEDAFNTVGLFIDLSRCDWGIPGSENSIRWTKGQPLGLRPSFASFALTHGILLHALNGHRHDNKFFVLGDDVVILEERLYQRYLLCLEALACPISPSKSIVSNTLAEFGGKLISMTGIEPQLKWRQVSDDNFLDVLRNIGPGAESLLRSDQRKLAKKVAFIPDFLGGLGWNPDGIPLAKRIEMYLDLLDEDRSAYLMSLSRKMSQYFYDSGVSVPPILWKDTFSRTFDQKVALHVINHLKFSPEWSNVLGVNLHTVAPEEGLPIVSSVRRTTLLQRLVTKFK
jgi:hypothetical protein